MSTGFEFAGFDFVRVGEASRLNPQNGNELSNNDTDHLRTEVSEPYNAIKDDIRDERRNSEHNLASAYARVPG